MILDFILLALGIYFIYKVIFELIIPVFRTTQRVRQQFNNMQDQMNATQNQNSYTNPPPGPKKPDQNKSAKAGDYIDFEEVK